MATRRPLVIIDGVVHRLPIGDIIGGPTEVDCVELFNVGPQILPGKAVYISGDDEITLAQADALGTANPIGLATETINTSTFGIIQVSGVISLTLSDWIIATNDSAGLSGFNSLYFLDTSLPKGSLTDVEPTTSTQFKTIVGRGISSTKLKIIIERAVVIP